ncbi:hypothetical protein GCM10007216_15340 [Thalassobacillus devorans]|uniref:HTH cro/C1-type domain-containing protein n=1 Tax=Thalassobacillus devorans TaxID=279813 RepID=A0ABQ1NWJ5_9BACI|nr:hypothetical protein [Thalassobacillus devorans]NIK28523.1 hypothetical protein [Thalassobacillus devorans]GGC85550.1 hypothetical protein GCM10007216_15340 [Thalassobacillus devorans]
MNLKSRIDYLCHINGVTIGELNIPSEEIKMLENGLIQLPPSSIQYLSKYFDRPVSYFADHMTTDQYLHHLLQKLQNALLAGVKKDIDTIVSEIEFYQPIPSLHQEMIYHLLLTVYHYQKQMFEHAAWIEDNYLSYFLDKPNDLNKHNKIFDKALFHYLGIKYYFQNKFEESDRYFEELFELAQGTAIVTSKTSEFVVKAKSTHSRSRTTC